MEIQSLEQAPLIQIVDCLVESFTGYFVEMPSNVDYWKNRFQGARVDYGLSFGMFDNGKLIGFIINGIDYSANELTAFNTGTGVVPAYRGNRVVDKLYEYAIPLLKDRGVSKCELEVIRKNTKAINVYKRIGFTSVKLLKCFKGKFNAVEEDVIVSEQSIESIINKQPVKNEVYSWDNNNRGIITLKDLYRSFVVTDEMNDAIGYFIINPLTGSVPQFELHTGQSDSNWQKLFAGISQVSEQVKINNVDGSRAIVCQELVNGGLENYIDQELMEMRI